MSIKSTTTYSSRVDNVRLTGIVTSKNSPLHLRVGWRCPSLSRAMPDFGRPVNGEGLIRVRLNPSNHKWQVWFGLIASLEVGGRLAKGNEAEWTENLNGKVWKQNLSSVGDRVMLGWIVIYIHGGSNEWCLGELWSLRRVPANNGIFLLRFFVCFVFYSEWLVYPLRALRAQKPKLPPLKTQCSQRLSL